MHEIDQQRVQLYIIVRRLAYVYIVPPVIVPEVMCRCFYTAGKGKTRIIPNTIYSPEILLRIKSTFGYFFHHNEQLISETYMLYMLYTSLRLC